MKYYWVLSNILQGCALIILVIIYLMPQRKFGSQGYSGYGQVFVLLIAFAFFVLTSLNTLISSLIGYGMNSVKTASLVYGIAQFVIVALMCAVLIRLLLK